MGWDGIAARYGDIDFDAFWNDCLPTGSSLIKAQKPSAAAVAQVEDTARRNVDRDIQHDAHTNGWFVGEYNSENVLVCVLIKAEINSNGYLEWASNKMGIEYGPSFDVRPDQDLVDLVPVRDSGYEKQWRQDSRIYPRS